MYPRISVIIPSIGASTLRRTFESIVSQGLIEGDQILVVQDGGHDSTVKLVKEFGDPFELLFHEEHCWGNPQRNYAMQFATGDYLVFQDEDDAFTPGAFDAIRRAAREFPGTPFIFRFTTHWGETLPRNGVTNKLVECQIGGHCGVFPNNPAKLGKWGMRYAGDFDYLKTTMELYPNKENDMVWRPDIISVCRPHLRGI